MLSATDLNKQLVPRVPKVALVVVQLGLVVRGYGRHWHHSHGEIQQVVQYCVGQGSWDKTGTKYKITDSWLTGEQKTDISFKI